MQDEQQTLNLCNCYVYNDITLVKLFITFPNNGIHFNVIGWHLRALIKFNLSSVCRVAKSNSSSNFQSYMLTCLPIPTLEFLFVLLMRFELTRPNGQGIFLPHLLLHKQYSSKLTAHLYLTTDFDIISWLLTFTLTTVNHFSFLSILWPGLFQYHIS